MKPIKPVLLEIQKPIVGNADVYKALNYERKYLYILLIR